MRYVETRHPVTVDTSAISVKNAEDAVADLAARLLPAQMEPGKRSALEVAKDAILNRLAGEILTAATEALAEAIDQLRPAFERTVSSFTQAVRGLPEPLTSDALVTAGPSVVDEFQTARSAAQFINTVDAWLASLVDLPSFAGMAASPALRVLSPSNSGELAKLERVHATSRAGSVELELGTLYVCAARENIAFSINTPRDSALLRQNIESAPRAKAKGFASIR